MEILFERADRLYGLWALLPLLLLMLHARGRRRRAASRLMDEPMRRRLLPQGGGLRSWLPPALILLAFASLVLAASRPRFGVFYEKVSQRGADLVVILDVSRSMLSEDVHPSRLSRSKSYIRDLLARVRGDRVGLVVFAGKAVAACPLTTDQAFFDSILTEVGPHSAPRGGTVIGDAIREATRSLDTLPDRDQAFLLITDGEDQDSFPLEAAAVAADLGVKIFTVGVGDPDQGARIPRIAGDSASGFVQHEGQEVWSRMDEQLLEQIALESGGAYVPVRTGTYDLGQVYTEHLAGLRAGVLEDQERRRYREQYQLFAALGLVLLLLASMTSPYRRAALRLSTGLLLGCLGLASAALAGEATRGVELHNQALEQLRAGDLDRALELFQQAEQLLPDQPRIRLGHGAVLQRRGALDDAREQYLLASSKGDKPATAVARYNLGTVAADRARAILGDRPEEARGEQRTESTQEIERAIEHFLATLRLDPEHQDARYNLELLRLWLKHIRDAWKRQDEQSQAQEKDLAALLQEFLKQQEQLRVELRAQRPEAPSPRRDEALLELGERQQRLAERLDQLPPKIDETFEQAAQAGQTQGPGGPDEESQAQLAQAREQVLALVEATRADMARAAEALGDALPEAALEPQRTAYNQLEAVWKMFARFPQLLRRAVELEQGLVQRTVPLVEASPGAPEPDPLLSDVLIEEQGRVGALAPLMLQHAERLLPQARAAADPDANQATGPRPDEDPDEDPDEEPDEEQQAQIEQQRERARQEVQAFELALENLPRIPDLSEQVVANLKLEEYPAALPDQEEILALLREIAELLPKDPQQQQGDPNQEEQGDQDQEPEDDQQEQDQQDQEQQDDQQQDPEDQPDQPDQPDQKDQQDQALTPQQIEKLLEQVRSREQEYKQKKRELQRLLVVPVPVERDW